MMKTCNMLVSSAAYSTTIIGWCFQAEGSTHQAQALHLDSLCHACCQPLAAAAVTGHKQDMSETVQYLVPEVQSVKRLTYAMMPHLND
jgi:hypothetical protein